ncbi:MAG: M23 family metallopeptidase [Candidatus Zixiibacteriota bacterium]|nr:MAG: M23 family metallopeptidase [candidate division Zixibacteria bacterium]
MRMEWLKQRLRSERVSILLVPEKGGRSYSLKLPLMVLQAGIVAVIVGAVFLVLMTLSWATLQHKASTFDRLVQENEGLLAERDRVLALQERVEQLQVLEARIRKVLGADLPTDSATRPAAAEVFAAAEGAPESRLGELSAESAPAVPSHYAVTPFNEPGILKELDVPSLWPVRGYISRNLEIDPVLPQRSHFGLDLAAAEGTVVKATAGGVVVWTGWSTLYGNVVILAHASGYFSMYGHNQVNLVRIRERIERGAPIALLGNTGQSSAPHLHFEIWHGNQPLDPTNLLMPM